MKKLSRRKMYQKRRKKEKKEKIKKMHNQVKTSATNNNCLFNNQRNQMRNCTTTTNKMHYNHPPHIQQFQDHPTNRMNSYTEGMRLWWRTYCTAIQYHSDQQRQWQEATEVGHFPLEGGEDRSYSALLQKYAEEYETSSDEEDEEEEKVNHVLVNNNEDVLEDEHENTLQTPTEEEIDLEYLKFIEITHKHREELRLKREAENCCQFT